MIDLRSELESAQRAVRTASELVQNVQRELGAMALTKGDRSPVTVADFASQALVVHELLADFPGARIVAEEDSERLKSSDNRPMLELVTDFVAQFIPGASPEAVCSWIDRGAADPSDRFWTLDPIDGTKGFLRGDQYVVALALVEAGKVQIGLLGCPNLRFSSDPGQSEGGWLITAVRGAGAWRNPLNRAGAKIPLHVSERADPAAARMLRSYEAAHTNTSQLDEFAAALGIRAEPVRLDSQAKYALLAGGEGELILRLLSPAQPDYEEKIWDQAAGALIVEEAGGRITDLMGRPLDFTTGRTLANNRGVLASNDNLHDVALKALKQILSV